MAFTCHARNIGSCAKFMLLDKLMWAEQIPRLRHRGGAARRMHVTLGSRDAA